MGTETHQARPDEKLVKVAVYMPESMKDELIRRAETADPERPSSSKVVRDAVREYSKRHPEKA